MSFDIEQAYNTNLLIVHNNGPQIIVENNKLGGRILFMSSEKKPAMLTLCPNGDVFVGENLAGSDEQIFCTLREWANIIAGDKNKGL
jgi:precorrin-6B methylase 1